MSIQLRLPAMGALLFALLLLASCNRPARLLEANAGNLRTARTVAAAFYEFHGEVAGLPDVPFVTVGMDGGQGYSYDEAHNVLFVTPFSHADFDTQRMFAKACQPDRADDVYNDLMFRFFTAHQLMHLYYKAQPLEQVSLFEEEIRIHTLTWIFLRETELLGGAAELTTSLATLEAQLKRRFPVIRNGSHTAADLVVDDNASYWYVTAVSMCSALSEAGSAPSGEAYLASLPRIRMSAEAGR